MSSYDRPYPPYSRDRERRRMSRRSDEAERGPWGARDPSEFERRYRGRDPYENEEEGGGFGEQGFEPRRRWESEDWQREGREREFGGEPRFGEGRFGSEGGVYSGTPSQQRGWERYEQRGGQQRGFEERGGFGSGEPSSRGRFAGRGPKGYQRSDERLREEICDRLTAHPDVDASDVSVEVKNGEVTLEGSVPDRRSKRSAEDCVEEISGVRQVHVRLRVESKSDAERGTTGAGGHSEAGASEGQRSTAGRRQGS
jgi:osmotically-inducible protein OsmY